jgi:hypothetical protein
MEGIRRRREFEQAIRDVVARLKREGKDRIERTHVEEVGARYDLKPEEARDLFVDSKGEYGRASSSRALRSRVGRRSSWRAFPPLPQTLPTTLASSLAAGTTVKLVL